MNNKKDSIIMLGFLCVFLASCGRDIAPSPVPATQPADTPHPSSTSLSTPSPRPIPSPTALPNPTAQSTDIPSPKVLTEPLEISGYWIQNTTRQGLCSDFPRIIGFDESHQRIYFGGNGADICFFDTRGLEEWTQERRDPPPTLYSWFTVTVPNLETVTAATDVQTPLSSFGYGMPSVAGIGGRCFLAVEEPDQEPQWRCETEADGIPFNDILGYGVSRESGVEWFMSRDQVASHGLSPKEQSYSISELTGSEQARFTRLGVGRTDSEGVWVGTNGYGVIHIEPLVPATTRYTLQDGLPGEEIRDIQVCGEDCVWIATAGGIGHWDGATWTTYTVENGLPSNDVRGISLDKWLEKQNAVLWAATAEGAAFCWLDSGQCQTLPDLPAGVEVNGVMHGVFSTHGHGLLRFQHGQVIRGEMTSITVQDGLPSNHVTALAATTRGILVGTPLGAVERIGQAWVKITTAPVNSVSSTSIATEEGLWVYTNGGWVHASDERVTLTAEGGWYATPSRLCQWREGQEPYCPTSADGRSPIGVQALYASPEQGIAVAVDADSLWIIQTQATRAEYTVLSVNMHDSMDQYFPSHANDVALCDPTWIWIATEKGVYKVVNDPSWGDDVAWHGWYDAGITSGWPLNVRRIAMYQKEGGEGEVWVITDQGVLTCDCEGFGMEYVAGLAAELTDVLPAPDGSAWFGTADNGLIHFVPARP